MSLNVLHIANTWGFGGTEKAAELFVRNHSDKISAYAVGIKDGGVRADGLRQDGYEVIVESDIKSLCEFVRKNDIDIAHSHSADPKVVSKLDKNTNIKYTVRTAVFGWLQKGHFRDMYLFPSNTMTLRADLLDKNPEKMTSNMGTLYNPLDIDNISTGESLRSKYNISTDTYVLGKIGRSAPEKWSRITLDGFEKLINDGKDACLFLLGAPKEIRQIVQDKNLESSTKFIDTLPLNQVGDFYATIDVLAHSSLIGESFGYVIAESMANGVPVIVNSTPMRDNAQIELIKNQYSGLIVSSPKSITTAMKHLFNNPSKREKLGENAKKEAKRFIVSKKVQKLENCYMRLIDGENKINSSIYLDKSGLDSFKREYSMMLSDNFGEEDLKHIIERLLWKLITSTPIYRKELYKLIRYLLTKYYKYYNI